MVAAGHAADGIITSSRQRLLTHLCAGDSMEKHLRVPYYTWHLANCVAHRASA